VIDEPDPAWHAVLEELRGRVAPSVFARIACTQVIGREGEILRVAVASEFDGRWLERALGREVAGELTRFDLAVRYEVPSEAATVTILEVRDEDRQARVQVGLRTE
jgi:ribosomal protein S18 acetylase RimI-like enzyme